MKTLRGFLIMITASTIFCASASASAVAAEHFDHIIINYEEHPGKGREAKKKVTKKEWVSGCRRLGAALTPKSSPWAYGLFNSFSCRFNGKTVVGENIESSFSMNIDNKKSGLKISVAQNAGKKKQIFSDWELIATKNFAAFFRDPEFIDLLALSVLESLPASGVIAKTSKKLKGAQLQITPVKTGKSVAPKYEHPDFSKEVVFYRLNWDVRQGLWRSHVVGTGALKQEEGGRPYYQLEDEVLSALQSEPLYLHRSEGPVGARRRWKAILNESTKTLDFAATTGKLGDFLKGIKIGLLDTIFGTAASGYVGFKYGLQVLQPEGELGKLIGKTRLISVLVEIRSGPVKGLRYYYDKLPKTSASVQMADGSKDTQYVGFARHIVGYSFGFDLDSVIDRLSIDPKLGIWTFNARLPAALDESGKTSKIENFNLGRTFSLALEGGIEKISDWYVLRGWGAMDTGFSLLKSGGKVTSYRYGIDAFLTVGPEIPVFRASLKTTWVLFYVFDRMDIVTNDNIELTAGEDAITGVAYDAAYAGAGVTLSW